MGPDRPRLDVAIGIVIEGDQVLISKRPAHVAMGGLWEFPGGKQRPGESPEAAVVRELQEELAIAVIPTGRLAAIEHEYVHASITLTPVFCRRIAGEPVAVAVSEFRWVPLTALTNYAFPPANAGLLQVLAAVVATERKGG